MEIKNEKQELQHETRKPLGPPLDQLTMEVETKLGDLKLVPALHIGFSEGRHFICYKPPPSHVSHTTPNGDISLPTEIISQARIEEWLERMEFLEEDLHWLLHLPPHRFWSQVIYDESLQRCLESYLCYAPRYHDIPDTSITEEMSRALQHMHKLVFMVFLRMSTYKESKSARLGEKAFGEIIYDCFLFDIPKVMDLCILYGPSNRDLLQKMIKNIFDTQPCYMDDLMTAIPTIHDVFDTIQEKFGLDPSLQEENSNEPRRLSDSFCSPLSKLTWNKLKDLIFYLVDTSATLSAFIDIYPPSTAAFHKQGTVIRISKFYEVVFPALKAELQERSENEEYESSIEEFNKRLQLAKSCLIRAFRDIVFSCCIQPILDGSIERNANAIEDFLQIMSISVIEKSFVCDYQTSFPFEDDLDILSQACGTLDSTRIEYILSSIFSSFELLGKEISFKPIPALFVTDPSEIDTKDNTSSVNEVPQASDSETNYIHQNGDMYDGACASPRVKGIELDCLVTQVLEVLGDLGIGFIEKCLEYYNYNPEKVISVILDDNLPVALKKLDRQMKRPCDVFSERKNIYDEDEFDVFNRDTIDMSRIHKGKRNAAFEETSSFLKKEKSAGLQEIYEKYSIVEDTLLYDDEYDDTYDDTAPEAEPPHPGDILYKRTVTTPRVLEVRDSSEEDRSPKASSENENLKNSDGFPRDNFVEDPAEVRNRLEQKYQQQQQRRRYDVKGKPRGQGQDQTTSHNRQQKEKHKSNVANHSRRYQHDRKYSKGMYPS